MTVPVQADKPCHLPPAMRAGDFVFISGQVAMKENGEIEAVVYKPLG